MVSAAKAFAKEPPKEPLDNLSAIVRDFQWRYVDRLKTDQVIAFCGAAPDFAIAVQRACEARDENGKHHNHQSKVDITARRKFGRKIIRGAMAGRIPLTDFDELHDALDRIKPYGIGPVTVYDTAIRVSAYLGIKPTSVYMHAGVRHGAIALRDAMLRTATQKINGLESVDMRRIDKIPVAHFPRPLSKMDADDVEDILCTYREVFLSWR